MAEKKIYVDHKFQLGAKPVLANETSLAIPSGSGGELIRWNNRFYMHNGSEWDEVVTNESFGNSAHQIFDNKTFDGGQFST